MASIFQPLIPDSVLTFFKRYCFFEAALVTVFVEVIQIV